MAEAPALPVGRFSLPSLAGGLEWESLGLLRAIAMLRVGYLGVVIVPLLAYAINTWNTPLSVDSPFRLTLPFSMLLTFVGSAVLSTGHLLNEIFCARLVKIYGTLQNYQASIGKFVEHENMIFLAGQSAERNLGLVLSQEQVGTLPEETRKAFAAALSDFLVQQDQCIERDSKPITEYRAEWKTASASLKPLRYIVAACYISAAVIGAILVGIQVAKLSVVFHTV